MDSSREIHFDGWTLHTTAGELVQGDRRIRLQTQPQMILEVLLERPGELVTREELIARLWPKGIVDFDTALNSAVHRLRTALADNPESPRHIETIPRRGYRFIGRLDPPPVIPAPPSQEADVPPAGPVRRGPAPRRWPLVAAGLLLVLFALTVLLFLRTGDPQGGRGAPGGATSAEAEERFRRAEYFFQRRALGDIDLAQKYYLDAIEIDPGFARAWAGLAGAYWIHTVEGRLPPEQGLAKLRDAAERALALDPGLAEAHLRLANYRSIIGDWQERDAHMRMALELEPDNPLMLSFSAGSALERGDFDAAVALQRRAVEADSLSTLRRYNLAAILYQVGRLDEAKAELLELRELSPTPGAFSDLLGLILIIEDRYDEALELIREWPDEQKRQQGLALAYHGLGRSAEADAALRRLIDLSRDQDQMLVAEVYAYRGDKDAAFAWLQAASEQSKAAPWTRRGRRGLIGMPYSPFLRALHADSRWDDLYESSQRPQQEPPRPDRQ